MLMAILSSLARHPRSAPISRIHERNKSKSESTTPANELLSLGLYHRRLVNCCCKPRLHLALARKGVLRILRKLLHPSAQLRLMYTRILRRLRA